MRDILFRGKSIDGTWHYGVPLVYTEDYVCIAAPHSYNKKVESITIGQYTGLTDKNGKKIFEGDIVKTDKFSEPNKQYIIKYDLQFGAFIGQDRYNCYFVTFDGDSDEFEVIGNIHDNPELLEIAERR